jgi:Cu(I)/Ag(I) efflux system membrane fusion protein
MVPDQRFDQPGKSPFMDMQLVPKYADDAQTAGVSIAPGVRQNLGIRTVQVKLGSLPGGLQVPGTLTWDLRREHVVSARVDALIERLHVKAPYATVRAGQPLATVLAPAWSSAIAEYQALSRAQSAPAQALRAAARERLRVLGVPAGAIQTGDGRVVLRAPIDGVVSEIAVREGQTAMMGMPMFRINGTDTLWLEAAIPQAGLGGVAAGTPVEATVTGVPGETFEGRVETLLPQLDASSRTQRARIVIENPSGLLVPGMFAEVALRPVDGAEHPLVPTEALIATGTQTRVIVLDDNDRFVPVAVRTGRSGGGVTEILSGLKGGERVVASGQFLIDSEASLSGALDRLADADAIDASTPSSMPGMDDTMEMDNDAAAPAPRENSGRKILYWYDPMKPEQHFDKPGKSPFMDMQLVPKYADEVRARDTKTAPPQAPQP